MAGLCPELLNIWGALTPEVWDKLSSCSNDGLKQEETAASGKQKTTYSL